MATSRWVLIQKASEAKQKGDQTRYTELMEKIRQFDAKCKHRKTFVAECGTETTSDFGDCFPGDTLRLCSRCGKIVALFPTERRSGVRLRVR